ncbi:restriction endonuclease subunit S [Sulfitobacter mediterraneus]|uniref:restriction endonuclease subunit S n=1 Tax=Sulfitobacter mediterraneus TaxID=83219 RepID=UPI0021A4D6E0|nr:restriction endonuclease subunit S [Sulfitobacter mediterraneus]UWR12445.1 restriction endonuclease subunit S [Sulfitobacter mediterraneus]
MSNVPEGWTEAKLEDLTVFILGGDWGKAPEELVDESALARCIRASELRNWDVEQGETAALRRLTLSSIEKRTLRLDDLLVEISGGGPDQPVGRVVRISQRVLSLNSDQPKVCTNFFRLMRPSALVEAKFVEYYLKHFYETGGVRPLQGGSNNLRNLKFPDYVSQFVPLAPLKEQRRIVEKIENLFAELDKGEESLRTAKARAGLYRQSLLKHAFEGHLTADWRAANPDKLEDPETLLTRIQAERDARYKQALDDWQVALEKWRDEDEEGKKPAKPRRIKDPQAITDTETDQICSIPSEWCWARPDNLASPTPYSIGIGPFGSNLKVSDYRDEGIPLVFVKNITRNDFSLNLKYVDQEKFEELQAHTALPNDILITKMGDPPGDCAIYPASSPVAVITADCLKFRTWDEFIDRKFVAYCLMSQHVRRQLGVITRGVAQKKISVERFKTIALPLPCQAEQEEISNRLEAKLSTLDTIEEQLETQIARCKALRQSILKRAFAGELVDQDPDDEPASKLLERIKAEKAEAEIAAKRDRKTKQVRKPKNRRLTMTDLIEVLKKEGDWVSASKAAQGLGIADGTSSDDVEAFYRQLKERIEANEIEVERRGDEDWLRLAKVEAT